MKKILVTTAIFLGLNAYSQQKILKYSDHEPLGNMRTRFLKEVLFKNIEKETHSRIKIEDHWNGELSTSYEALKSVSEKNLADITVVVPEYVPKLWTKQLVFKSFPTGPSGQKQVEVLRKIYREIPEFNAEIERTGVKSLMVVTGYPVAFFSTKPMQNLQNLDGQKWRTASFWHQDFLRKMNAEPVTLPWNSGITKALQDGTLDGIMVNLDGGNDFEISKKAPHILTSKNLWMGHIYQIVINENSWKNLNKKDQKAILKAVEISYESLGKMMDESFDEEILKLKNQNADVRILTQKELADFEAKTDYKNLQRKWISEQNVPGLEGIIDRISGILGRTFYK